LEDDSGLSSQSTQILLTETSPTMSLFTWLVLISFYLSYHRPATLTHKILIVFLYDLDKSDANERPVINYSIAGYLEIPFTFGPDCE
jgi:hypothetical protein